MKESVLGEGLMSEGTIPTRFLECINLEDTNSPFYTMGILKRLSDNLCSRLSFLLVRNSVYKMIYDMKKP